MIKSLVVALLAADGEQRAEVARLLARVLDFNEAEWARGRLGAAGASLSAQFVAFLERESAAGGAQHVRSLATSLAARRPNPFVSHSRSSSASSNILLEDKDKDKEDVV